ncbi:hypothetical protein B0J17DRAFT_772384 [Rhizoctonia solani]|nr:hypothetical protein B0J17DRAFT_772384 [Rhizoctonia solani]
MLTSDTGQSHSFSQNSEISIVSTQSDGSGPQRSASISRSGRRDPLSQKHRTPTPRRHSSSYPGAVVPSSQPGESLDDSTYSHSPTGSTGQQTPKATASELLVNTTANLGRFFPSQVSNASTINQHRGEYSSPAGTQASLVSNASLGSEAYRAVETIENRSFADPLSQLGAPPRRPGSSCSLHSDASLGPLPTERLLSQPDPLAYPSLVFKRALIESANTWDSIVPEGERIELILETFSEGLLEIFRTLQNDTWDNPLARRLTEGLRRTFHEIEANCYARKNTPSGDYTLGNTQYGEGMNWDYSPHSGSYGSYPPGAFAGYNDCALILKSLEEFKTTVNGRLSTLENQLTDNNAQQGQHASNGAPAQRMPKSNPSTPKNPAPNNTSNDHNSFAAAAAQGNSQPAGTPPIAAPATAPGATVKAKQTKSKSDPVRFVIQTGESIPEAKRLPDFEIYRKIKPLIDERSELVGGRIMEVKWNAAGNLVLVFTHSSNPTAILAVEDKICATLRMDGLGDLRRAVPWGKVSVSGVASGIYSDDSRTPHSKQALLDELYYSNPFLKNYVITQGPDWTVHPSKIDSAFASISFAFEDKDGKLLPQLLKSQLHMFGRPLKTRRWNNKQLLKKRDRCISYDHNSDTCKRPYCCARCGLSYSTDQHDKKCAQCKKEGKLNGAPCIHPNKCPVCKDSPVPHSFGSDDCPECAKYRVPVSSILHRSSDSAMNHE